MTIITTLSEAGAAFTVDKEGPGSKAYKDPVGIVTIGAGFTMRSKVFAREWKRMRGHGLRMGDTITPAETVRLMRMMAEEEYGPPVVRDIRPEAQHHFDASFDTVWNCGPGATKWKWAIALRDHLVAKAAALLATTAITAKGIVLKGLRRRRAAAARLLQFGDYGNVLEPSWVSTDPEEVEAYQKQLQTLGYDVPLNGKRNDPATDTAVRAFQAKHDLKVDGDVGPATRSALRRAVAAKRAQEAGGAGGLVTGTGTGLATGDWVTTSLVILGVLIAIGVVYWLWTNRGIFTGKREPA